jgi:hypothetical protein
MIRSQAPLIGLQKNWSHSSEKGVQWRRYSIHFGRPLIYFSPAWIKFGGTWIYRRQD